MPHPLETWTEAEQQQLIALAAQGLTTRQIGSAMGVSRNAIIGRARRTGVKLTPRPKAAPRTPKPPRAPNTPRVYAKRNPERREMIRAAYLAGESWAAIAKRAGTTAGAMMNYVRDLPRRRTITWSTKAYPEHLRLEAMTAFYAGESAPHVGKRLELSVSTLHNWRRNYPDLDAKSQELGAQLAAERAAEAQVRADAKRQARIDYLEGIRIQNAELLAQMGERDCWICNGAIDGKTLEEMGQKLGITRERVRQIILKWRVRGLVVPNEKPLSEAQRRVGIGWVPTGRPRGLSQEARQIRKAIAAEDARWLAVPAFVELSEKPTRRKNKPTSPEVTERRREHMRRVGLARRGQGKRQLEALTSA